MTSNSSLIKQIMEETKQRAGLLIIGFLLYFLALPLETFLKIGTWKSQFNDHIITWSQVEGNFRSNFYSGGVEMPLIIISALFLAFSAFYYLYSSEKVDFYHSQPVRRERMFLCRYLSGFVTFVLIFIPNVLLQIVAGSAQGIHLKGMGKTFFNALLLHLTFFILIYASAVIGVLLTGNLLTGMLTVGAILSYGAIVNTVVSEFQRNFFDTLVIRTNRFNRLTSYGKIWEDLKASFFSPVLFYVETATVKNRENLAGYLLMILILAVLITIAGGFLYKIRPSESSHKAFSFKKTEPVFKIMAAVPLAILGALFIQDMNSSESFGMFIVLLLIFSAMFCGILDFLIHMDVREIFRFRISTMVVVAGTVVAACFCNWDVMGVDTYLPKKEKLEGMSISMDNLNLGFYSSYYINYKEQLDEMNIKEFDDIYEMAKLGVAGIEDKRKLKKDGERHSFSVGYHLKSGKTVLRSYEVILNKKMENLEEKIYDNWEYRSRNLPFAFCEAEAINRVVINNKRVTDLEIRCDAAQLQELYKTFKSEAEGMTYKEMKEDEVLGQLSFSGWREDDDEFFQMELPIYKNFTNTLKLLDKMGYPTDKKLMADEVDYIVIRQYKEENQTMYSFEKPEEIQQILDKMCYDGIYGYVDYSRDLEITIYWKERSYGSTQQGLVFKAGNLPKCLEEKIKSK